MKATLLFLALSAVAVAQVLVGVIGGSPAASSTTITRVAVSRNSADVSCTPSCSVTVASTGAGHLLVLVYLAYEHYNAHLSSVSNGGTWVVPSGCYAQNTSQSAAGDIAYSLSSSSGTTSLSITLSANNAASQFAMYEYSGGTFSLDGACGKLDNQAAAAHQLSPSMTTTASNDVIVTGLYTTNIHYGSLAATGTGWTTPALGLPTSTALVAVTDALTVAAGTYQASFSGYATDGYASSASAFHN